MLPKKIGPSFKITNKLLTLRYWSQSYTTSLFNSEINNNQLVCQFPLKNINLDILKNHAAIQLYLAIRKKVYIARVAQFTASVDSNSLTLNLLLNNIQSKESWDMEFATPETVYESILADKEFFKHTGRNLDSFVKPLGLSRKGSETDMALRRRTLEYLRFKLSERPVLTDAEIRKMRGDEDDYGRC